MSHFSHQVASFEWVWAVLDLREKFSHCCQVVVPIFFLFVFFSLIEDKVIDFFANFLVLLKKFLSFDGVSKSNSSQQIFWDIVVLHMFQLFMKKHFFELRVIVALINLKWVFWILTLLIHIFSNFGRNIKFLWWYFLEMALLNFRVQKKF